MTKMNKTGVPPGAKDRYALMGQYYRKFYRHPFRVVPKPYFGNFRTPEGVLSSHDIRQKEIRQILATRRQGYKAALMARLNCPECGGRGETEVRTGDIYDPYMMKECTYCGGSGMSPDARIEYNVNGAIIALVIPEK